MKKLSIILILTFCFSCNNKKSKSTEKIENLKVKVEIKSKTEIKSSEIEVKDYQNELMEEKDILFNGKISRYFTINEFELIFGQSDSIKSISDEEPCSYIFENKDESNYVECKYFYKDGSRFENFKDKIAVDEFRFTENNFILFKNQKLNSFTTIQKLQNLFPNAIKDIGYIDVYREGKLQVIQLRESESNISNGHIKIFFKNAKLYFMHWWFPC